MKSNRSCPTVRTTLPTNAGSQPATGCRRLRPLLAPLVLSLALLGGANLAQARITKIDISSVESPTFEGKRFGNVGQYEKLRGPAYGEVDPRHPLNAIITDIDLAPTNEDGNVEYSMDIYILKPVREEKGNHKLFMEVNNRGNKLSGVFNEGLRTNDPATAADAGEGFLMRRGYTMVWSGWDPLAPPGNDRLTLTVPVATDGGETITGPSYEYINFDNNTTTAYSLTYPAETLDKSKASLTIKQFLNDAPTIISAAEWEYVDDRTIRLLGGTPFLQSHIYEFTYTAKDPLVQGLGLAATRDFLSFLRHETEDDYGNPNPLADQVDDVFTWTLSQPARYLNDFQTLGFNEDENGLRVIDGIENWIGGSSGDAINYRFGQTARTERNRQNHFIYGGGLPVRLSGVGRHGRSDPG